MSVFVSTVLAQHGRVPESVLEALPWFGLVAISAGFVRSLRLDIRIDDTGEIGHALAIGEKTRSIQNRLARNARWLVLPD
ncbi:MAG: hypothetical protein FJ029_11905 [Actinobacteria bacterium]|nr:hypothetical protein [Actinomycetota bacterium]